MARRDRLGLSAVRIEGAILPVSILQRIHREDPTLDGIKPEQYDLAGDRLREAASRAWNALQGPWTNFKAEQAKLAPGEPGTSVTRNRWLYPIFRELHFGPLEPLRESIKVEEKEFPISHVFGHAILHLVGCGLDLDKRTPGAIGAAKSSPHSLVQACLNARKENLWGVVTNGLRLRVLRDDNSLSRQSMVEFDLEAIFEGQLYDEFLLFFLVCHRSRFQSERPEQCWLERWSQTASDEGKRALNTLRDGVKDSIEALGQGFLKHPSNSALRNRIKHGELDKQDYYRQLLRMVYRLLFLFVAEDRGLLLDPKAADDAKALYNDHFSTMRLRLLAERMRGSSRHYDLFGPIKMVLRKLGEPVGCPELGLPALGGFLFSEATAPDLDIAEITNADLLEAVRCLAVTRAGGRLARVDYKNLGTEELGSVYESLLELYPDLSSDGIWFELKSAAGNERKVSGSYYTPDSLIQCLLDSALDPVVDKTIKKAGIDPEARAKAILDLRVIDPAVGSGHFLIAAAHRLAKRLGQVRTGEDEPSLGVTRHAMRDVIGKCLYGVDLNPMATELCKVSLWIEALEPGMPLSFLDHHVVVGNSLLGATPGLIAQGIPDSAYDAIDGDDKAICTLLKKQNKQERGLQGNLFDPNAFGGKEVLKAWQELESLPDDTLADISAKHETYRNAEATLAMRAQMADAWCAAFLIPKTVPRAGATECVSITTSTLRRLANGVHLTEVEGNAIREVAERFALFHPHLAFPDVFSKGGFDVVLGNPPWKMPEEDGRIEEADPNSDVAFANSTKTRRERAFFTKSGCFPYSARNRLQLARLFAEMFESICSQSGSAGIIVPSTITVNAFDRPLWTHWIKTGMLQCVWDFVNSERLFEDVDSRQKFCIIHLDKNGSEYFRALCWMTNPAQIAVQHDKVARLDRQSLYRYSGDELALPHFRNQVDLELLESAITRFGRVSESPAWSPEYILLGSTADKDFVRERRRADQNYSDCGVEWIPVYEGKMVNLFDHRVARVVWKADNAKRRAQEEALSSEHKADPKNLATPLYEVPLSFLEEKEPSIASDGWAIGLCDVTSALNERTALAAIVPRCFATHNLPLVRVCNGEPYRSVLFLGALGSMVLDYFARLRVATNHLTEGIFNSLPIPSPTHLSTQSERIFADSYGVVSRVLELTYTSTDLEPFARSLGFNGPPFIWDDERRFWLRAELDAAFFHLYGINRDDVDYIMETFPIVKRKDIAAHGSYRTKEAIVSIYDDMSEAMA